MDEAQFAQIMAQVTAMHQQNAQFQNAEAIRAAQPGSQRDKKIACPDATDLPNLRRDNGYEIWMRPHGIVISILI